MFCLLFCFFSSLVDTRLSDDDVWDSSLTCPRTLGPATSGWSSHTSAMATYLFYAVVSLFILIVFVFYFF